MFRIFRKGTLLRNLRKGAAGGDLRLEADTALTPADFRRIVEEAGAIVLRARKVGFIAARQASKPQTVETHWNGKETTNTARPGDWIAANLDEQQQILRDGDGRVNSYVILAERFADLYQPTGAENEFGAVYRSKEVVKAIRLPGGFDIVAPWGEHQRSRDGYLVCNDSDVYGNHAETFAATYRVVPDRA
jgi:hypothetical protein